MIHLRQGQAAFRKSLMRAYGGQCAVTATSTKEVLEAAHILPYRGTQTHRVDNGLLLRADIYTLFDRRLLAIVPQTGSRFITRVAPHIDDERYVALDREPLRIVPTHRRHQPSSYYLAQHSATCTWLT